MKKDIILGTVVLISLSFLSGCKEKAPEVMAPAVKEEAAPTIKEETVPAAAQMPQVITEPVVVTKEAERTGELSRPAEKEIQQALKNAGFYDGEIDGKIGPKTKKAVEDFQAKNNLKVDGKVGSKTWEKLREHLNVSPTPASSEIKN